MSLRALFLCWMLAGALPAWASDAPSPTPPGADAPVPAAEPPAPAEPASSPPVENARPAPRIEDLAVAADNPVAAPVISMHVEPVDSVVTLWWRAPGGAWASLDLAGSGGPLRLARLPDGVQRRGFEFYVDVVGNDRRGRFGSRSAPVEVEPAVEGNRDRATRDARDAAAFAGPHPALVMMALGTGVLAGAGAGAFGYDLHLVQTRLAAVDAALAAGPPDGERAALTTERTGLEQARLQDTTATVLLGVVGGVALATGVTLLIIGAVEQ